MFSLRLQFSVVTLITFALALTAIPISGTNCPGDCISYPYLDTVAQFPRDYRWMLPAIVLLLIYVVLVVFIHGYAPEHKGVFAQIGLAFSVMSAIILVCTYYILAAVVPVSLMHGETEGIAMDISRRVLAVNGRAGSDRAPLWSRSPGSF